MSRSGQLLKLTAAWETGHHTAGHAEHRRYLETMRLMWLDIALLLAEDASQAGDWLYRRDPPEGRVGWWSRLFLSWRMTGQGKNASEAVLEAAQTAVRMGMVHAEYMALEGTTTSAGRGGRYRTAS